MTSYRVTFKHERRRHDHPSLTVHGVDTEDAADVASDKLHDKIGDKALEYEVDTVRPSFDLLHPDTVRRIRADVAEHGCSQSELQYGSSVPDVVTSTGRARCRACGERIAKGTQCWEFAYDFVGSGSWTCVTVKMHIECQTKEQQS